MTYPTIIPALTLDFQNSQQLDPRISFSRSSSATYINSAGNVADANSDVSRFEFDSNGNCLGLLIEESRTNYTPQSTYVAANYEGTNSAATGSQTAPDGTSSAALWTENTSTGLHTVREKTVFSGAVAGDNHTWSVFVKPNGRTKCKLYFTSTISVTFDLTANTVTPETNGAITPYANGWYRLSVSMVNAAGSNSFHYIYFLDDSGSKSYTGDGTSGMYVWGWQVEGNVPFPTSYIPTSGSTVTRAADVCTISSDNFSSWYNQNEGTVFAKSSYFGLSTSNTNRIYDINDGGTQNRHQLILRQANDDLRVQTRANNVDGFSESFNMPVKNQVFSNALGYKLNDCASSLDGGNTVNDNTVLIPTVDRMFIGARDASNAFLNGHISRLAYYNQRLTDAELQTLTS